MSHRSIGQERFGFIGHSGSESSLDALGKLTDWDEVPELFDPLYSKKPSAMISARWDLKLPPVGQKITDGLAIVAGPTPAPVDQFARVPLALDAAHDRRHIGHPYIVARRHIGFALGHRDPDLEVVEILDDRGDVDLHL